MAQVAPPIWIAASEGHLKMVRTLHELGANVEATDEDGTTPLSIASKNGHEEVVKLLQGLMEKVLAH